MPLLFSKMAKECGQKVAGEGKPPGCRQPIPIPGEFPADVISHHRRGAGHNGGQNMPHRFSKNLPTFADVPKPHGPERMPRGGGLSIGRCGVLL